MRVAQDSSLRWSTYGRVRPAGGGRFSAVVFVFVIAAETLQPKHAAAEASVIGIAGEGRARGEVT